MRALRNLKLYHEPLAMAFTSLFELQVISLLFLEKVHMEFPEILPTPVCQPVVHGVLTVATLLHQLHSVTQ